MPTQVCTIICSIIVLIVCTSPLTKILWQHWLCISNFLLLQWHYGYSLHQEGPCGPQRQRRGRPLLWWLPCLRHWGRLLPADQWEVWTKCRTGPSPGQWLLTSHMFLLCPLMSVRCLGPLTLSFYVDVLVDSWSGLSISVWFYPLLSSSTIRARALLPNSAQEQVTPPRPQ